jgi:AraC family transcriptional regulator of adaptative response/methylated-DNA-[protein]-cysteine methyltransferase
VNRKDRIERNRLPWYISIMTTEPDDPVLRAIEFLAERVDENVTLEELSRVVGLSPFHLQRRFKAHTGLSPKEYATSLRLARFRRSVHAESNVTAAIYEADFGSSRGLYTSAPRGLGMTPGDYARGGREQEISYTIEMCTLGRVLVASTTKGVCAVLLGDRDEDLIAEMDREFGAATRTRSRSTRSDWTSNVVRHIDDTQVPLAAPLDLQGTPFQIRVWKALREIAPGERKSYSELAESLGNPKAVRAVGSACARNTIAVLVPCHRVVRKDGSLSGYRWGVQRKAALLEKEATSP